jgi:P27 family predicted phage terminase small subunit
MTMSDIPGYLRQEARDLIENAEQEYVFDPHERVLLYQAATALSLALEAAETIAAEGMTVATAKGGLKTHPAVAIQRNASVTFASLLKAIGLAKDGRRTAPVPGARNRLGGRNVQ